MIAPSAGRVNKNGRASKDYDVDNAHLFRAILAEAKPHEKERWLQMQHPISHTIVARGAPKAKTSDLLTCGKRKFFVQGFDNCGELGLYTIYYCEERLDQ